MSNIESDYMQYIFTIPYSNIQSLHLT